MKPSPTIPYVIEKEPEQLSVLWQNDDNMPVYRVVQQVLTGEVYAQQLVFSQFIGPQDSSDKQPTAVFRWEKCNGWVDLYGTAADKQKTIKDTTENKAGSDTTTRDVTFSVGESWIAVGGKKYAIVEHGVLTQNDGLVRYNLMENSAVAIFVDFPDDILFTLHADVLIDVIDAYGSGFKNAVVITERNKPVVKERLITWWKGRTIQYDITSLVKVKG